MAGGHIPDAQIGYGWSLILAPIARVAGPNFLDGLPALVLLQAVVLLPVALYCGLRVLLLRPFDRRAAGVRLALESEATIAEVLNLGESRTWTMGLWARHVLEAAGATAELTRVPDVLLPDDLQALGTTPQHLLVDSSKARDLLGWTETDPHQALARSVAWHLANPPEGAGGDFSDDDRALDAATR